MHVLFIGHGRLGTALAQELSSLKCSYEHARMDAKSGLPSDAANKADVIVFCLVPRHPEGGSGWLGLFEGVKAQIEKGDISLSHAVYISSTAVYECVATGLVDANTAVTAVNERTEGLLYAEHAIQEISENSRVFRLTGLIGGGYERYEPKSYSFEKPRQALDIGAAAKVMAREIFLKKMGHHIDVITDGEVYWQGEKVPQETWQNLLGQFRLLSPSLIAKK